MRPAQREEPATPRPRLPHGNDDEGEADSMRKYAAILAATALLVSTGMASAQSRNYDSSGAPKSSGSSPRSGGGLVDNSTTGSSRTNGITGAPALPIHHPVTRELRRPRHLQVPTTVEH